MWGSAECYIQKSYIEKLWCSTNRWQHIERVPSFQEAAVASAKVIASNQSESSSNFQSVSCSSTFNIQPTNASIRSLRTREPNVVHRFLSFAIKFSNWNSQSLNIGIRDETRNFSGNHWSECILIYPVASKYSGQWSKVTVGECKYKWLIVVWRPNCSSWSSRRAA